MRRAIANDSVLEKGGQSPTVLSAAKAPTARRPLPLLPGAKPVAAAPKAQFFPPAREPSDPELQHFFRCFAGDERMMDLAIELFHRYEVHPMSPDEEGYHSLHNAARSGHIAFFDFIMTDPLAKTQVDINAINPKTNTNPLSMAIGNGHFDLALKLIRIYNADIHVITRWGFDGKDDDTYGILRIAIARYYSIAFDTFTPEQKKSLEALCQELVSRGLSFFETKGSSLPPVFEIMEMKFLHAEKAAENMERMRLSPEQYDMLSALRRLKRRSAVVFELLCSEAENIKHTNTKAQDILDVLGREFVAKCRTLLKPA